MNKKTIKYKSIFDLFVHNYFTNNFLEKTLYKFSDNEKSQWWWEKSVGGHTLSSILLCPNFQIEMKVESAQNTAFDQAPCWFRKIVKGKCEVYILICLYSYFFVGALNKNTQTFPTPSLHSPPLPPQHRNKRQDHSGRKIFFLFKNSSLGRVFPSFLKLQSVSVLAHCLQRDRVDSVPSYVCWCGWESQWPTSNVCTLQFPVQPVLWEGF